MTLHKLFKLFFGWNYLSNRFLSTALFFGTNERRAFGLSYWAILISSAPQPDVVPQPAPRASPLDGDVAARRTPDIPLHCRKHARSGVGRLPEPRRRRNPGHARSSG